MESLRQCISLGGKTSSIRCGQWKELSEFVVISGEIINQCKECKRKYNKQRRESKKELIRIKKKQYADEHKEEKREYDKRYRIKNKEKIKEKDKNKYERNKNNPSFKIKINKRARKRRAENPYVKLREYVSNAIYHMLKNIGATKKGKSISQYLQYSIPELKQHIELLFEPWMTWENRGVYNKDTWNDNDPSTWTWQLDHIIPHSTFKYETMDCEEFRKCWALSNLQPLSAKQNQLDGATKIRHKVA